MWWSVGANEHFSADPLLIIGFEFSFDIQFGRRTPEIRAYQNHPYDLLPLHINVELYFIAVVVFLPRRGFRTFPFNSAIGNMP